MVKVQRLSAKTNLKIQVCRTDKIPLGTKGRTSILSYREYVRPAELHSRSAEENCPTGNVASLRSVKVATPPLRRLCGYPLWTCRPQTVLTNRLPPASLKIRHKQILRMV